MTDKSAAELEREAEAARARVANTAESLRSKMTPGQIIDEMTGMFSNGDGSTVLNNLKAQVRDNPLPLTLVGAGLAWLMLGSGSSASRRSYSSRYAADDWDDSDDRYAAEDFGYVGEDSQQGDGSSITDKVAGAAHSAMQMASGVAGAAKQTFAGARHGIAGGARSVAGGARSMAGGARGVAGKARGMAGSARGMGSQARHAAEEMFDREPLMLAAVGLTLGTAIGAMLPHTRIEDETLGKYGKKLREAGEDLYEKGVREAKDVASEAYSAVKDEADRQGLTGDSEATLADRIGEVMKSATERTEEKVRDKIGSNDKIGTQPAR